MMAAETMKEYLVGIGFDLDEGGAAQADAALQQLDGILKNLGKVLENTATAIRELLTEFRAEKVKSTSPQPLWTLHQTRHRI